MRVFTFLGPLFLFELTAPVPLSFCRFAPFRRELGRELRRELLIAGNRCPAWVFGSSPNPSASQNRFKNSRFSCIFGFSCFRLHFQPRQDRLRGRNLGVVIQMRVHVGRGGEIAVAQPFLNLLHGHAVSQQEAGTAVPLGYNNDKTGNPYGTRVLSDSGC